MNPNHWAAPSLKFSSRSERETGYRKMALTHRKTHAVAVLASDLEQQLDSLVRC